MLCRNVSLQGDEVGWIGPIDQSGGEDMPNQQDQYASMGDVGAK